MTNQLRHHQHRTHAVENLLQQLVDDYYHGAHLYHALTPNDSGLRVFWRIRLAVLADIGTKLAAAIGCAEPDWETLNNLATETRTP
jgi:hypothetical protein